MKKSHNFVDFSFGIINVLFCTYGLDAAIGFYYYKYWTE